MKLSIIIPTFNEENYLPKLITDIKKQTFQDFEIIVSDGDSQDKTRKIALDKGARVVVSKDRSPAMQRNKGAEKAKGEILLFLDADSRLTDNNFLKITLKQIEEKGLDAAGFVIKWDGEETRYRFLDLFYYLCSRLVFYVKPFTPGAGIIVKKSLYEKSRGFNTSLFIGEDHDYGEELEKLGKIGVITDVKIITSVRRFEKEGFLKTNSKWATAVIEKSIRGKVGKRFEYKYGDYD